MTDHITQLAAILRTTEKNAIVRAQRMKLTPACGRCGGSGNYSYNQMDGTRCFGCAGAGHVKPSDKAMPMVIARAEAAAADGTLDAYLKRLEDARVAKTATKTVLAAWSASRVAKVNCAVSHGVRDHEVPHLAELRAANKWMYDAVVAVERAAYGDVSVLADLVRKALVIIAEADYEPPADLVAYAEQAKAARDEAHRKRFGF